MHNPYKIPVGSTISLQKKLHIPKITVNLITKPFGIQPINYGGIETGTCTQVGQFKNNRNDKS